jgi:hypothetical protein
MGISYELQRRYRQSHWLTPISTGVMVRTGEQPTLYSALSCLNKQNDKHFFIGALSALELAGYAHYVPMGKPRVVVGCPQGECLPAWMEKQALGFELMKNYSASFDQQTGITTRMCGEFEILLSTPERAFMEALQMAPKYYNLTDLYPVMEQLTALRPTLIQQLLEQQVSIKVKRLFLYMAEKANHPWYTDLDVSRITLGNGKRCVVKNGVYDPTFQLVIPENLKNYA